MRFAHKWKKGEYSAICSQILAASMVLGRSEDMTEKKRITDRALREAFGGTGDFVVRTWMSAGGGYGFILLMD